MGARQVLRVAAVVVAALVAAARPAAADEPVVVIDLRPGDAEARAPSRAAFRDALGAVAGIAVRDDAGLDAALAGDGADADTAEAEAALAEAREAYGALDCARAAEAAGRAIDRLAARQAAGLDADAGLRAAWAYVLLCADRDADRARAQTAADRLRALGVATGEEVGVADATWRRYPEIDASTDREIVGLTVTTEPAGAAVWVDHRPVGAAPVTVYVPAGEHVVAAADGARRGAARVTAASQPASVTLRLTDRSGAWAAASAIVQGWRDGALTPTAESLGSLMQALDVRFALVLAGKETVQVWARGPGDAKARKLDDASRDDVMAIGAIIADRVAAWDGRAPDPDRPLLVETDAEREARRKGTPTRWWVYAAIVGAVAAGTAILYLQDAADDRQRIEIRF